MNETKKLYDTNPYDTDFDAVVLDVQAGKVAGTMTVVLDSTLFFPEEGGQTPDRGVLAGFPIVDVQLSEGGVIQHTLQVTEPPRVSGPCQEALMSKESSGAANSNPAEVLAGTLSPGKTVHGTIDWTHRFSNMQNHSGEHILSGLLHQCWGYENVGFRLSDNTVTLDTSGPLSDADLIRLENMANAVIWRNVTIRCEYPSQEELSSLDYRSKKAIDGPVRIVTIEGVDACACCAPHVRRTGEIGLIKILSAEKNRGATRLTFLCGERALAEMQHYQAELQKASRLMNEPVETISSGVQKRLEEIHALKNLCRQKEQQYLQQLLAALPAPSEDAQDLYLFEEDLSPLSQRELMNRLCEMGWRYAGVFVRKNNDEWQYLIGSRSGDATIPGNLLRESFGARGGGKPAMVQGTVKGSAEDIQNCCADIG